MLEPIALIFGVLFGSYLVFGVLGHLFFNVYLGPKLPHRQIYKTTNTLEQLLTEAKGSVKNITLFGVVFFFTFLLATELSLPVVTLPDPTFLEFLIGFFGIQLLHDAYFYWTHRLMHKVAFLRKIHVDHHVAISPTPLGSMSFHIGEGGVHAAFFILIAATLPIHWSTLAVFYAFQSYINMWGHTNYEFWPKNLFRTPVLKWLNTPTHHIQHHRNGNYNFGIYYNFWDKFCGTNNPKYQAHYEELQTRISKREAI